MSDRQVAQYGAEGDIFGVEGKILARFSREEGLKSLTQSYKVENLEDGVEYFLDVARGLERLDEGLGPVEDLECDLKEATSDHQDIVEFIEEDSLVKYEKGLDELIRPSGFPSENLCYYRDSYRFESRSGDSSGRLTYSVSLRPVLDSELDGFAVYIFAMDHSRHDQERILQDF